MKKGKTTTTMLGSLAFFYQFSDHSKILQCRCNCRFLFRRPFRLSGIFKFWLVVVLPLNNAIFLLDLGDV